jgi:electron transfer flavoprotein alpha subunit
MTLSLYDADSAARSLWVYLERDQIGLAGISLELLSKGRQLADQVGWSMGGLIMGEKNSELSRQAIAHGADEVWSAEHELLRNFTNDAYAPTLFGMIMEGKPGAILFGATPDGRDLAGCLAVRLRTGLNADCTGLRMRPESGELVCDVSGFGGGVLALIEMGLHRPQMATVRPGVFSQNKPDWNRSGEIIEFPVLLKKNDIRTTIVEKVTAEGVDLTQASIIIAGGRGVEGDFETLGELAGMLGGEVGGTRPPVDEGHIERERQIGQTGVVCSPKVALCCGISGAFHFVVGVEKAEVVIAINSDPDAPIFEHADFCVVGDVRTILPLIKESLKSSLAEGV